MKYFEEDGGYLYIIIKYKQNVCT